MSPIQVTFLGTGTSQGIPMIACECDVCKSSDSRDKRLRVSIHVEIKGKSFIVDTGPDFRQQILREGITHVDAVIYTHEHKDHTAGMDDIRGFNYAQKTSIPKPKKIQKKNIISKKKHKIILHIVSVDFLMLPYP